MDGELKEITDSCKELREFLDIHAVSIAHEELGIANGFQDAEKIRKEIFVYLDDLLRKVLDYAPELNFYALKTNVVVVKDLSKKLLKIIEHIEQLASNGVHASDFPTKREDAAKSLSNVYDLLKKNLYNLEIELKNCELNQKLSRISGIEEIRGEALAQSNKISSMSRKAEQALKEANKLLNAAQSKTINREIESSSSHFGELYRHHKKYEENWLLVCCISAALLVLTVIIAVSYSTPESIKTVVFFSFLKRLIIVSVPAVFLKVSISKYNAERNLRILYAHREKVLQQYQSFEVGIGNDSEAKNQFRLEVARYIFSDPRSNYDSSYGVGSPEININPIFSALENVSKIK